MTVKELDELLKNMKPSLDEDKYYMVSIDEGSLMQLAGYLSYITCLYREDEGLTVLFSEDILEDMKDMGEPAGPFAKITLNVYSDLMAVGFLAKITEALAEKKISVNAFSAYHHDHLFVPYGQKDDAMKALIRISESAK